MKKKIKAPRLAARARSARKKVYQMEPRSAEYGRVMELPVADGYEWTGKRKVPMKGDVFLGSDGFAWFAAIDFRGDELKLLKPVKPKAPGKKVKARK